jgi:hypothetical protein
LSIQSEEPIMYPRLLLLIFPVSLLISCDHPFSTRKPEPPVSSQSSWIPPHAPEDVLENFVHAVQERNTENYMRCFVEETSGSPAFRFVPDPEASALYPHLLQWTLAQEENMIRQTFSIVHEDSLLSVQFTEKIREIIAPDSVITIRNYQWQIHHDDPALPRTLEGQVEVRLSENTLGEWAIYTWIDHSISDTPSFSIWKASLGGIE